MPLRSAETYFRFLRSLWRDLIFRAIVLGTLAVVASVFASRAPDKPGEKGGSERQTNQSASPKVENDGFFGIGPDSWTAIFTGVLTLFTAILAGTAIIQIRFLVRADETARISARAAQASAEVATKTLVASHRAWLDIDVSFSNGDQITFYAGTFIVNVVITVKNIGNSPAISTTRHVKLFAHKPNLAVRDQHEQFCAHVRKYARLSGGVVFPGAIFSDKEWVMHNSASLDWSEIEDAMKAIVQRRLDLYIGGCVEYFTPSDDQSHQTTFLYHLMRHPPNVGFDVPEPTSDLVRINGFWLKELAFSHGMNAD